MLDTSLKCLQLGEAATGMVLSRSSPSRPSSFRSNHARNPLLPLPHSLLFPASHPLKRKEEVTIPFSNFNLRSDHLGILLPMDPEAVGVGRGLRFCISNKLGDADTAGPQKP